MAVAHCGGLVDSGVNGRGGVNGRWCQGGFVDSGCKLAVATLTQMELVAEVGGTEAAAKLSKHASREGGREGRQ